MSQGRLSGPCLPDRQSDCDQIRFLWLLLQLSDLIVVRERDTLGIAFHNLLMHGLHLQCASCEGPAQATQCNMHKALAGFGGSADAGAKRVPTFWLSTFPLRDLVMCPLGGTPRRRKGAARIANDHCIRQLMPC